ncbi:CehA/McbA family metallohydrolase [Thermodesulfobacteriota bacterium]
MFDFEYTGNIHIHSDHSDGAKPIKVIAESAAHVGIDFICINDHSYMKSSLDLHEEGFYGNVLVLVGLELGKRHHHYLAYGINELIRSDFGPQETIDLVNEQGGFGFMAHPFEKGMPFKEKSIAYSWEDRSVTGFSGLSIWNFMSRWKERVKTIFHGIFFLIFPIKTLKGPSRDTISFWDSLSMHRRVTAVGGSDAHGTDFRVGPIKFKPFSYEFLFNSINIHVFLNSKIFRDFDTAKRDILDAMKEGRLFISHDNLQPAKGFKFYFISVDGSDLMMGEEDLFRDGKIIIELPASGEIRLFRNGILIKKWRGMREVVYTLEEKGVYRVEVHRRSIPFGWRPWIFTNPIYLR